MRRAFSIAIDRPQLVNTLLDGAATIGDDSFLLLFNASEHDLDFTIPVRRYGQRWSKVLDTALPVMDFENDTPVKPGDAITVINYSMQLFRRG